MSSFLLPILQFVVSLFRLLAMSEMSFIDLLREKQKERAYKVLGKILIS